MRLAILSAAVLTLVLVAPSRATEQVSEYDRFQLWNGCRAVDMVVEGLPDAAGKIGLHEEDIATAVRA